MMQNYRAYWQKMFVFDATATRVQYWWAVIINYIIVGLYAFGTNQSQYINASGDYQMAWNANSMIFALILGLVWLANFTIRARRLHDTNRSNWWILISIIPVIGQIWLFILLVLPSKANDRWPANQSEVR